MHPTQWYIVVENRKRIYIETVVSKNNDITSDSEGHWSYHLVVFFKEIS